MKTRVQKWGNSLAIRIPRAFAAEAGLDANSPVELTLEDGRLVIHRQPYVLEELLAQVTKENLHGEIDFGPPQGHEVR